MEEDLRASVTDDMGGMVSSVMLEEGLADSRGLHTIENPCLYSEIWKKTKLYTHVDRS